WWRNYQPAGANIRLGVTVTELQDKRRLRVDAVAPNGAADGVLKPGDLIKGANRHAFSTEKPWEEIQREVNDRPNARWIDLLVDRGGVTEVRRIPLPFVDPVQLLRRTAAIGRLVQRVVYRDDISDGIGPRGFVTIEMRTSDVALYPFELSPGVTPVSSPP